MEQEAQNPGSAIFFFIWFTVVAVAIAYAMLPPKKKKPLPGEPVTCIHGEKGYCERCEMMKW